jgi:two-component system, OmpR family, response regulator VicR
MIRITTYCITTQFLDILIKSLIDLPATITMKNCSDDLLESVPPSIFIINDFPDGLEVLQSIRKSDFLTPIIFVTNYVHPFTNEIKNSISGHNIIVEGYALERNLLPQLKVLIKTLSTLGKLPEIRFGNSVFNYVNREMVFADRRQVMTRREAEILKTLYLNRNNIVLRDDLIGRVWGKSDSSTQKSFSVYLCSLKKIIRRDESICIRTVRGRGYIFYMENS